MRNVYLVSYDVANEKRLRKTFKKMCGFGDPLQYSVFRCELSPSEKQVLKESLWAILNLNEDRIMLVNLGPVGARGDDCTEFWGQPRTESGNRVAVIV
ncbi:MAG: CRISPR-associated endonuclease Cas2 [Thermoguttaceae bacterium]